MTAEVAVMNRMAIALAADSAVTVVGDGGRKVYNTVNKLFRFSASKPVGIMIYGNSELMGIPWETIIKTYTKKLGDQEFDTLQEYADQFINSLDNGNPLFSDTAQEFYVFVVVRDFFSFIEKTIEKQIDSIVYEEEELTNKRYRKIVCDTINKFYKDLMNRDQLTSISNNHDEEIVAKYEQQLKKRRKKFL